MTTQLPAPVRLGLAAIAAAAVVLLAHDPSSQAQGGPPRVPLELSERAARDGRIRVLVELNLPGHVPDGRLPGVLARLGQRQRLNAVQARVLSRLSASTLRVVHRYATLPYVALEVDASALAVLEHAPDVIRVLEDRIVRPVLAESAPLIQSDQAWAAGFDGAGTTIAVLDTGVEASHPFFAGKVVEEACYSSVTPGLSSSFCPGGQSQQIGPGAAAPCWLDGCYHGTHVAGIAAGNGDQAGQPLWGVARGADIMAVQVFSQIDDVIGCGGFAPCLGGFTSDIIAGLERVYAVAASRHVVAVNMSLGEGQFYTPCDSQPYKPMIDSLRAIGVASIVAAGNDGYTSSMMAPACVSSAVSVGATDKSDRVAWFSNAASFLSLFAPGEAILSSVTDGDYDIVSGTSMAAPHVAGAWAVLKQADPGASVTDVLAALRATGQPITDTRPDGSVTAPRVSVYQALASLVPIDNPSPEIATLSPSHLQVHGPAFTLTVTGSGFNVFSVVRWNGSDRPTTIASATIMRAAIPESDLDLTEPGSAEITVFTPAPGGGTSAAMTFTIDPPPSLTVDATEAPSLAPVTVTLHDGLGGSADWLALAATSASNTSYVSAIYVGAGVTTRTWTTNLPAALGTYEFRLFKGGGYTRLATSPAITAMAPAATVTSISPTTAPAGNGAFTLTVSGSNFLASSVVRWNGADRTTTYVAATQVRAAIPASDLASDGTASVTVFNPAPGGGTSGALTFTISQPPSLSVNAASGVGGTAVTVTLVNGYGGATDWLALAATSAPNTSYVTTTYVGTGVTTRTWTTSLPATLGTYEFRLFKGGGYTRLATSPAVTVLAPAPAVTSLSPTSVPAGNAALTLAVSGSSFLASSVVGWNGADRATTYVSATLVRAAIPVSDLAAAGTAAVTVFTPAPGGGTSVALTFTIDPPPSLTVSTSEAAGSTPVTVTLQHGFGGATDWLALAATSAPNTTYVASTYVGTGVTTRTWTTSLPPTAGTYEFRLFKGGGFTRLATSPAITALPPAPIVTTLTPAIAAVGSGALTLSVSGGNFSGSSVVRWNGDDRTTTYVSASQLRAAIPPVDLAATGTAAVTVFTPAPGGGTSPALTFTIGPAPTLSVSATSVLSGTPVTVTLANGLGGSGDKLAFAASGAPDASYLQSTSVGAGVTTRTWTVTAPALGGTYEFRLLANGSTRVATSPAVTVVPQSPPVLTVSESSVTGGSPVTVTLTNGFGGAGDWLALATTSAPNTSYVKAVNVGAGLTSRTWTVTMPATGGTFEFRLFVNGYTRAATSAAVAVSPPPPPTLAVSESSVTGGSLVTVTLTNGLGGTTDWLALAATGAPNTSYVQYVHVGAGVTSRTWTVAMPSTAGTYEFRLFLNNVYIRAATSPPITVTP